jgi:hypothetical protein
MGLHGLLQGYLYLYLYRKRTKRTRNGDTQNTACPLAYSQSKPISLVQWIYSRNSWIWGPYSGDNEQFYLLGYNAASSCGRNPKFCRNILPPTSGPSVSRARNQHEAGKLLDINFLLGLLFTLKMEEIFFSEMWNDFHRTSWCYIPDDRTPYRYKLLAD